MRSASWYADDSGIEYHSTNSIGVSAMGDKSPKSKNKASKQKVANKGKETAAAAAKQTKSAIIK
jgi:hypothetical protein